MKRVVGGILIVALLIFLILGVRGRRNGNTPLMLVWDMDFQPKYKPQAYSPYFADGRTQRTPPAGVVAFDGGGERGGADPEGGRAIYGGYSSDAGSPKLNADLLRKDDVYYRGREGNDFVGKMPVEVDAALLRRGRERYTVNCVYCHGATGAGNGITTQYGMVGVPTYHDGRLRGVGDGYLFDVITNGKNTMMPYGHQIKVGDRWAVVAYVRALQRAAAAAEVDVPEIYRGELGR